MKHGFYEGEDCGRDGCDGIIEDRPVEGCSCHINPPCSACTSPAEFCPVCDWEAEDDPIPSYQHPPVKPYEPKPLDTTKIDWRCHPHTHFTMIRRGCHPKGTTRKEVLEEIGEGTFGGRFNYFTDTSFEYIAYTD